MHELTLCQSLLRIIEQEAERQAFSAVRVVWLEVGDFAAVEEGALRFAFDVARRGTPAANARLEIVPVDGEAWCPHCQCRVVVGRQYDACPECGHFGVHIRAGDTLRIKALEVE
jgi:hydrogenase nickel incorporation protein HypA/HybF